MRNKIFRRAIFTTIVLGIASFSFGQKDFLTVNRKKVEVFTSGESILGNRYLTLNTVVRVNQIEATSAGVERKASAAEPAVVVLIGLKSLMGEGRQYVERNQGQKAI